MTGAWGRFLVLGFVCGLLALADCAAAGAAGRLPELPWPPGMVDLGWSSRMRLHGAEMALRLFEAPGTPWRIAARINDGWAADRLKPLLGPWPDGLVMSNVEDGAIWFLQLRQVDKNRTRGLYAARVIGTAPSAPARRPEWVPEDARLLFDLETGEPGSAVLQQAYAQDAGPAEAARRLRANLARSGWRPVAQRGDWSVWRKAARQAQVVVVPQGRGSGFLLTIEEGVS